MEKNYYAAVICELNLRVTIDDILVLHINN